MRRLPGGAAQGYWMFALWNAVFGIGVVVLDAIVGGGGALFTLFSLASLLPSLAVSARRLHDTNRCGWWILISFVPFTLPSCKSALSDTTIPRQDTERACNSISQSCMAKPPTRPVLLQSHPRLILQIGLPTFRQTRRSCASAVDPISSVRSF